MARRTTTAEVVVYHNNERHDIAITPLQVARSVWVDPDANEPLGKDWYDEGVLVQIAVDRVLRKAHRVRHVAVRAEPWQQWYAYIPGNGMYVDGSFEIPDDPSACLAAAHPHTRAEPSQ